MGKKYTTDEIGIGDHSLDSAMMSSLASIVGAGLHSDAGYLTTYTDTDTNTQLTDAQIAAMGYIKTDTNTTYNFAGSSFTSRNSGNSIAIDSATSNMTGYTTNATAAGFNDGALFVAAHSTSWVSQIFSNFRTGELSTRGKNNGSWQAWRMIHDSGHFSTADVAEGVTAHGWGDHADAGYLTSYTDTNTQLTTAQIAAMGYISKGSTITPGASWTTATKFKSSGDIGQGAGNHSLQILSDINNDAFMAFHISSDYAIHFGLDNTSNRLYTGGWSDGTGTKYQLYDSRDFSIANVLNSNITLSSLGALGTGGKAADSELLDGLNSTAYMRDDGWNTNPGQDADTQTGMRSDFSYGNNAPNVGELLRFGAGGYSTQFSSQYAGVGKGLNFRTRNGDAASWNPWYGIWHTGNLTNNNQLTNGSNYVSYISTDQIGASLFYDINDTNYFLDLNATSRLNRLQTVSTGVNKNSSQTTKDGLSLYGPYTGGEATYGMMFTGTAGSGTHGAVTSDWATYFTMNSSSNRGWIFRQVGIGNYASISAGGAATFDESVNSPIINATGGTSTEWNTAYTHSQAAHAPSNANYTSSTPTFSEVYNNGWFRNNQTNEGMYNQATGNHWYSDGEYWNVGYSGTTGIRLRNGHNGTVLGTLYGETTGHFGLLDNNNQWAVRIQTGTSPLELRCDNNVEFQVYNSYTVSPGSSRAPLFFDSNNTAYYIHADNHSYLHTLALGGNSLGFINKDRDAEIKVSDDNFNGTGAEFVFWGDLVAGNAQLTAEVGNFTGQVRTPVLYDSNNTAYVVNPASTSTFADINAANFFGTLIGTATNANTLDNIDSGSFLRSDATDYQNNTIYQRGYLVNETGYRDRGVYGNYNSTKTNHIWSMGTAYKNSSSGANFGNLYGLAYKHTNNTTGGNMAGGHQMVWCSNGTGRSAMGDNIWTLGNVKAPLYYDSNNTGYYLDPASTSNLDALNVNTIYSTPIVYAANQNAYALKIGASNNTAFDQGIKIKSTSTGQSYMSFNDRSEDALVLRGAKVGIGTDNPGYRLDVSGNGRYTSTVTATNFILSSDKRLKNNIKEVDNKHISVDWKTFEMNSEEGQSRYGVIAQELEETHPEFVNTDPEGFKSVKYIDLLIAKIAELEARLEKAGI